MKSIIKHFYFNKSERLALFIFVLLLLFFNFVFQVFKKDAEFVQYDFPETQTDWVATDAVKRVAVVKPKRIIKAYPKLEISKPLLININHADSFAFRNLPGIGEKYSSRIVRYRNWLGGFYATDQLLEVYGIDSTLFTAIEPYLKLEEDSFTKLNLNTCSLKELSSHPYISYKVAKLMVKYREHHGVYLSLEELKSIPLIDEQLFRKIAVYLELE